MRERREQQQLTLSAIAEQTKIKASLLEALERDDVSHWPAGLFRRAFVRAYAHALGLDPDVVVREFLALYPDPIEDVVTAVDMVGNGEGSSANAAPPTRLQYLVRSAIDSLARTRRGVIPPNPSPATKTPPVDPCPIDTDSFVPDFRAAARLCTELGRVDDHKMVALLLEEAVRILGAVGLIVWVWDPHNLRLNAVASHGYSDQVLRQLRPVRRDADNATALAFRRADACVINGTERTSGALVVPLMAPAGCVGVLAVELPCRTDQAGSVRALVTIFAAQLARWVEAQRVAAPADALLPSAASEIRVTLEESFGTTEPSVAGGSLCGDGLAHGRA